MGKFAGKNVPARVLLELANLAGPFLSLTLIRRDATVRCSRAAMNGQVIVSLRTR